MTTTYLVATTTRPHVFCPTWCEVSDNDHVAELANWEGHAIHEVNTRAGDTPALRKLELGAGVSLCADGTDDNGPESLNGLHIQIAGQNFTPAEALKVADAIRQLVGETSPSGTM